MSLAHISTDGEGIKKSGPNKPPAVALAVKFTYACRRRTQPTNPSAASAVPSIASEAGSGTRCQ